MIPRAEMLAELMRLKYGIAVAGTHGKTTTTSLIAAILARGRLDPTTVIGGKVHAHGHATRGSARASCWSPRPTRATAPSCCSSPVIAVVTNIDPEHLDYYGDMDRVRAAFLEFINRVPFYGVSVLCLDSVNVRSLLPQVRKRVDHLRHHRRLRLRRARPVRHRHGDACARCVRSGEVLGTLRLRLPGRHHALNALAAIAVAEQLGVPFDDRLRGARPSSAASTAASSSAARPAA